MKIRFLGLLTLVLIVLKLTPHIDWSLVWVLGWLFLTAILFILALLALVRLK